MIDRHEEAVLAVEKAEKKRIEKEEKKKKKSKTEREKKSFGTLGSKSDEKKKPKKKKKKVYKYLTRDEAEQIFYGIYHQRIEPIFGRRETNSLQLDKLGKELFGKEWGGVHPSDMVRKPKEGETKYWVGNVDDRTQPGSHWNGYFKVPGKPVLIYDSFGRKSEDLLPEVIKQLKKYIDTEHDAEQTEFKSDGTPTENCGGLVMAWLLFAKMYGFDNARLI